MTIESRIEELTAAITALTAALSARAGAAVEPLPVHQPVAALGAALAPAPVMPAPPTFTTPVVPAAPAVPFSDPKGLMDYVMSTYKALGQQKGAEIQKVLAGLGVGTINEIRPDDYPALYAGIEALKA
jgi:hypothetical protein